MRIGRLAVGLAFGAVWSFAGPPAAADGAPPFTGSATIVAGDTVDAAFGGFQGEVHQYTFVALAGSTLDASVAPGAGSALRPTLRLAKPGGDAVPVGRAQRTPSSIRGYRFAYSGEFVLEVAARGGSGSYSLRTGGRAAKRIRGRAKGVDGDAAWRFFGVEGQTVSVTLSPRGRAAGLSQVRITELTGPDEAPIAFAPVFRRGAASIVPVTLATSGRYEVAYTVSGRPADVSVVFTYSPPRAGIHRTLGTATALSAGLVDAGTPEIAGRDGYVGSAACGHCHGDKFAGWSQTPHSFAARTWDRAGLTGATFVNDVDDNARDDFQDGLDLAVEPAFAAYGANAPKLSYVAGAARPYKMRIGTTTYDVERVMGGNGLWRQRYLLRSGRSLYPAPVEYDEAARAYSAYAPENWYDGGGAPRAVAKETSFEVRCAGCHNTGLTVARDAGSGEFVTGYSEFNIGCEQCHGPGAEHAKMGDPRKIRNPADLLDRTKDGIRKANDICGRCHQLGNAIDPIAGTGVRPEYGFTQAHGVSQAFDDPLQFVTPTNATADFWGLKTNPFPALPGDTFLAARSQPMEAREVAASGHAPNDEGDAPACFECHDPHSRREPYLIASRAARDPSIATSPKDNSLCLSCHAGGGDFLAVSKIDVAAISAGPAPVPVVRAVVDHMKDSAGMPVADAKYDPAGTGVGRCVTCHMPRMATAARYSTDKDGHQQGDLMTHSFEPVWPNASVLYGVTNSCNVCHPTSQTDIVGPIIRQWADKGADGDSTFHADRPSSFQNGTANAGSPGGGARCAGCHTSEGFARIRVNGETLDQAEIDKILKESIGNDEGITCKACHGRNSSGSFLPGPNPLRLQKKDLCGACHNAQTVVFDDFRLRGEMVRHPQDEMLKNTAGSEPPGTGFWATSFHTSFTDRCVTCHYDKANHVESHEFQPRVATCTACHAGLTTFDRTARADYDGDGVVEGVQEEVDGLLDVVKSALLLAPAMRFDESSGYFDYAGAADHKLTGASDAQKRAAFNWYSVKFDGSRGIHNTARAVRLLQQSYKELRGVDVPGATIR